MHALTIAVLVVGLIDTRKAEPSIKMHHGALQLRSSQENTPPDGVEYSSTGRLH